MIKNKNIINLLSLMAVQASNALLPLVLFPYLFKVLGAEYYAKIAISETIAIICLTIVIYSFDVEGVAKIIVSKTDKYSNLSDVFNRIFFTRILMFTAFLLLFIPFYFLLAEDIYLYALLWLLLPLGYIFQNSYFYVALEDNLHFAIINVLSRLIGVFFVFVCVNNGENAIFVPMLVGGSYVVGGVLSFFYAVYKYDIKVDFPKASDCFLYIKEGKEVFSGNISVMLYRDLNVVILGIIVKDATVISTYSIAEKLVKGFQATMRPINQLFYPKVIGALTSFTKPSPDSFRIIAKKTKIQLLFILSISVMLVISYFTIKTTTDLFSQHKEISSIASLFFIMNVGTLFGIANFMFGVAGLNLLNNKKSFAFMIIATGIIGIILATSLSFYLGGYGAAISFSMAEVILFVLVIRKYLL
jgi:PST family polysaccharide transporter